VTDKPSITRRGLVRGITATSLLPLLGANLFSCSGSANRRLDASVPAAFLHGVASGDPLPDRIILWTRLTPEQAGVVQVHWEIASDEAFTDVVGSGSGETSAAVDFTVKVDASGLAPGSSYYYRFTCGDRVSPVGMARTAPAAATAAVSFAVVSCSNYPAGYFHAYREVASRPCDAVLHLGDYIYEYEATGYAGEHAAELGRVSQPSHELRTLSDYRARYAQYRTDPDLQACHAAHPFIIVWDDHEVANDAWREGAQNHDFDTEGGFPARRAAAIQAWYEWLPVRPPASEQEIIYRRFQYGDLVDLFMLDTRVIGRDRQLDHADFVSNGTIDAAALRAAASDSQRTLLGATQREWLKQSLANSEARWQVLGQQVLMGRLLLPEPAVRSLLRGGKSSQDELTAVLKATLAARAKTPATRTPAERALLGSAIPINLDAWDGYDFEREDLLRLALQLQSRLVVLSGDSHNSWASQLTTGDGEIAGVEFAGTSVTSPGAAEARLGVEAAGQFAGLLVQAVDDLKYAELVNRGFMLVRFSTDSVRASWYYVSAVGEKSYVVLGEETRDRVVDRSSMVLA